MPLAKALTTSLLFLLGLVLLLLGVAVGGWMSAPFVIAVWAIAYLIENSVRKGRMENWKTYLGLPIFCIGGLVLSLPSAIRPDEGEAPNITKFNDLEISTGVLKKGLSRDISIVRRDGSSLSLLCGDNAGRHMTQTCISDNFEKAYGKQVNVYHAPEFKMVTKKAFFYEVRYGGAALVNYNDIRKSAESRWHSQKSTSADLLVMLFVSSICSTLYVWLRWWSQRNSW